MEMPENNDELLLEDLLSGKDRLLTSGEVAELLNVNANTLYLWRTSPEVNLPFQRFVAPGQSRGMIRYRYADVVRFIGEARQRAVDEQAEATPAGTQRRTIVVELSDEEELSEVESRIDKAQAKSRIKERAKNKAKKNALKNLPLEELLKFKPEFVAVAIDEAPALPVPDPPAPDANVQRKAEDVLREMMESFNRE